MRPQTRPAQYQTDELIFSISCFETGGDFRGGLAPNGVWGQKIVQPEDYGKCSAIIFKCQVSKIRFSCCTELMTFNCAFGLFGLKSDNGKYLPV